MRIKKTAFLFPGQGSQCLSLLDSLASDFPLIESVFSKASSILGYDVWQLAQQGPLDQLNQTIYTQPILLTAGASLWELWQTEGGPLPDFLAGHSLGEYTAYTCAGSFSFEEAVALVAKRGRYMQEALAGEEGAMAVIVGLNDSQIISVCQQASQDEWVSPSNYNTSTQIVIAGHHDAVDRAIALSRQAGAKLARKIPVSIPAHCPLMQPATRHLAKALNELTCRLPSIPVINNVGAAVMTEAATIKQSLVEQLCQPVRWVESMQWLLEQGVECFIECGPGQVLTHLIKCIAPPSVIAISIGEYKSFQEALSLY
jgi:[acyl-carrier-protein] S-malonyltransferase